MATTLGILLAMSSCGSVGKALEKENAFTAPDLYLFALTAEDYRLSEALHSDLDVLGKKETVDGALISQRMNQYRNDRAELLTGLQMIKGARGIITTNGGRGLPKPPPPPPPKDEPIDVSAQASSRVSIFFPSGSPSEVRIEQGDKVIEGKLQGTSSDAIVEVRVRIGGLKTGPATLVLPSVDNIPEARIPLNIIK